MSIRSMTGFARSDGRHEEASWHWEIRSVNGRGLDLRMRLPPGMEGLEQSVRESINARFARGNISANLTLKRSSADVELRLDEENLQQVLQAADRISQITGGGRPSVESLLAVRGVLEVVDKTDDEEQSAALRTSILASLGVAIRDLDDARRQEGEKLEGLVAQQLKDIQGLVDEVARAPSRTPEAIRRRLEEQIERLLQASKAIEPERLHQEAALLATKADVVEEIDRLNAHVVAGKELLAAGSPVGRKLDFLTQEFNREANTLCSKSNHIEITRSGLAMKALIDQMREQVQNIE